MVRKADIVYKDNVRGGEGTIEFRHVLAADELLGHGTMYAHVIIPGHCSLGFHQHVDNTEPYYVLKGKGIFVDNDGSRTVIEAGDVCVIEVGQSHAIENPNDEPLEIMALVINQKA